jgi:hypothetical protein
MAQRRCPMHIQDFSFGRISIDGSTYERDVIIEGGQIHKRKKKPSKRFKDDYGHTPLSNEEKIPWNCKRLVIGTGAYGSLPVMREVREEAKHRNVVLEILPIEEAVKLLSQDPEDTNAILHVTC